MSGSAWATSSSAQPTVAELLDSTPFNQADIRRVLNGGLVSTGVKPVGDHEVAVGLACLAKETGAAMYRLLQQNVWIAPGELIASERINDEDRLASFENVSFEPDYLEEAAWYVKAKAGDDFNLSTDEIETFRSLPSTSRSKGDARVVLSALRQVLLSRYLAYRKDGLQGILPYDRGSGKKARPSKLLHQSLNLSFYLKREFPAVHEALIRYPDTGDLAAIHDYHWLSIEIEGRPVFALSHRLTNRTERAGIAVTRVFYISRALDAAQVVVAMMTTPEGTLVLYVSRIWTERVTGFGKAVKTKVARNVLKGQMVKASAKMEACK